MSKKNHIWRDNYINSVYQACTHHCGQPHIVVINTSKAEVCDLESIVSIDENVLWLEVSVDDAITVQEVDTTQDLVHQVLWERSKEQGEQKPCWEF